MTKRRMLSVIGFLLLASVFLGLSLAWSNNAKEKREEQQAEETFHIWTGSVSEEDIEFAKAYGEDGSPVASQLSSEQKLKLLTLLNSLTLEDIKAGDGYISSGAHISMKDYDGSDYLLKYDGSTKTIYFSFDADTHLRLCRDDSTYWETDHSDLVDYCLELTSAS